MHVKREKAYEGPCYILDHSKIKVGDILLTTSDALVSSLIRAATGSAFSHAAVFVQDGGVVIEAVHPNVKLSSVLGMAIRDRKNVKVLRWAASGNVCDTQAIAQFAHSHVFKDYSRTGAVLSRTPGSLAPQEETELFCSQLIASSYLSCGLSLTNKAPEKTTPADIANSENMVDITDDVLIKTDTKHLLVERFVEHGSAEDLSKTFHHTIKRIVDTTVRACPFVKKLELKSLEEVIASLVLGDKFFTPDQVDSLARHFSLAVNGELDGFIEKFRENHSESFVQHDIIKLVIKNNWATNDQLRHHLKFLQSSATQTQRSLELRKKNIEQTAILLETAPSNIANLSVIKTIERFYNDLLIIEHKIFKVCTLTIAELRSHLGLPSA